MNQNENKIDAKALRKNRIKFLLIVALFAMPILGALYLNLTGWRPKTTINHGTLVQPARPAPELLFTTSTGKRFIQKGLEQKWNILIAVKSGCDEACLQNLHAVKQIHIAQGKHAHRVRRIFIYSGKTTELAGVEKKFPNLVTLKANSSNIKKLQDWVSTKESNGNLTGVRVFMIDPLGNYMMYYSKGYKPAKMRKDLARLLRVSHIG